MHTGTAGSYTLKDLESPADERERLRLQADWQRGEELAFWRDAGAVPGARVLDLGCGGGEVTRQVAGLVAPGGSVIGVDRDPSLFPVGGTDPAVEFRIGTAGALGESLGVFDLVYGRFLLQHVPDPQAVVRNAAARLKPGGRMAFLDSDDGLILSEPADAELSELLARAESAQWRAGGDRRIGRRLPGLLHGAGLTVIAAKVQVFTSIEASFPMLFHLATGYKAALIGERQRFEEVGRRLAEQAARGVFFFSVGVVAAIGEMRRAK